MGANHWRATVIFKWLVHVASIARPDSAVSLVSKSSQCAEIRMKGVMAILAHGAIKRSVWPALTHA
jgi:hypothetical protein